jgi:threonine dehydrogenase-like Zn-dependent dehydrogenase
MPAGAEGCEARERGLQPHNGRQAFEITDDIIENWERYALIVSHVMPFDQALEALDVAKTPGAADKVVVVFGEA